MTDRTEHIVQSRRAQRRDGLATRQELLEAAGKVFAERGFRDATSKEICALAGANSAAVNYHFGGKEGLYEEVLVEAHKQMLSLEDLSAIIDADVAPEEKLRAFLGRLIRTAAAAAELWGIRVFLRELAAPTHLVNKAMSTAIFPKAAKMRLLIHEITGLPPDSPRAQRAVAFMVLPCISLIVFPENLRTKILPATAISEDALLEDLFRYVTGGLRALGDGGV